MLEFLAGAIVGCLTCVFLLNHFSFLSFHTVAKALEQRLAGAENEPHVDPFHASQSRRSDPPAVYTSAKPEHPSPLRNKVSRKRSSRRRKQQRQSERASQAEREKNYPWTAPILGSKEPLFNNKYSAKLQAAANNVLNCWRAKPGQGGWTVSVDKPDGYVHRKKRKDKAVDIIKASCSIPFPVEMVMKEIGDHDSKLKFEANSEEIEDLLDWGEGNGVGWTLYKTPTRFVTQRDSVVAFGTSKLGKDGPFVIGACSVVTGKMPENPKYVRSHVEFGGWVFEQDGPHACRVTYMADFDAKGSIPGWIANRAASGAGNTPFAVKEFMLNKYGPYKPPPRQPVMDRVGPQSVNAMYSDGVSGSGESEFSDDMGGGRAPSEVSVAVSERPGGKAVLTYNDTTPGSSKLTDRQRAELSTKLSVSIAQTIEFTDPQNRKLWKKTKSLDKGVAIYRRRDHEATGYMGKSIVKFPPEVIFNALKRPDFRREFDPMLRVLRVLEDFPDQNLAVMHMEHRTRKCAVKISRDVLVALKTKQVGPRKFVVAGTSTTHPACPEMPNMKRVIIGLSGWTIEEYKKREGHSIVSFVLDVNFGGLSKKIQSYVNKRQVMAIHDVALALRRREKETAGFDKTYTKV